MTSIWDFNLYYYGLDAVNVKVDNKEMSLEEALKSGKLTLQGIIQKANRDEKRRKIRIKWNRRKNRYRFFKC